MLFIRGRITKRKGIDDEDTAADMLVMHYRIPYESNIDSMLHFLLVKVSESHFNSEDSEILYKKIVRLFHKMDSQQGLKDLKESTNNFFNDFISTSEDEIKQDVKYFQKYAKLYAKYGLDFGVSEDLLKIIKDFQADFLN